MCKFTRWLEESKAAASAKISKIGRCTAQKVPVQVKSMDGAELAQFSLSRAQTVRDVKQHLELEGHTKGLPPVCQRLLMQSRILSDLETLARLPNPLVMTFVLLNYDSDQNEVLIEAARRGKLAAVERALSGLADPNYQDESGQTCLHLLASQGHLDAICLLCESGANPAIQRNDGATPFSNAALHGHAKVVEYIYKLTPQALNQPRQSGATPVFLAAQMGHLGVVKLLCSCGADPNKARADGATPLFVASQNGHAETVKCLCQYNANFNATMPDGATPLFVAAQNGHIEIVQYFCDEGADIDKTREDLSTPLFIACQRDHLNIIRLLCDSGADTNLGRREGALPVHILAHKGNAEALRIVVGARANLNAKMRDGAAPLSIAAQRGNLEAVMFLLDEGAAVNSTRKDGATALILATHQKHPAVVQLLLDRGADMEKATQTGMTAASVAELSGDPKLAAILGVGIASGANAANKQDALTPDLNAPTDMPFRSRGDQNIRELQDELSTPRRPGNP